METNLMHAPIRPPADPAALGAALARRAQPPGPAPGPAASRTRTRSPAGVSPLTPLQLARIDRFVEERLEGAVRIDELAQLVGLSRYHFLRCFKRAAGRSPLQYILAKRVARAQALLAAGEHSIAEIAYAVGFSSQSHLNITFKRLTGITPGAFQRARRGAPDDRSTQ